MEATELAVVGSGPGGLAAAFRLQQAGYRVRVFEAGDRPGGKMRTLHRDGFLIEEGPTAMTKSYRRFLGVVADAGLEEELVPASTKLAFARDGRFHHLDATHLVRDAVRLRLVSNRSKLVMGKLLADWFRHRRQIDPEDLTQLPFDRESVTEYARRRLNPELAERITGPIIRGLLGSPPEDTSASDLFSTLNTFLTGAEFVAFRNGMDSYPEMLSKRFDLELRAEVTSVEERGDEVLLTWRDAEGKERSDRFAGCVVAVDAWQAAHIHTALDDWRRDFLATKVRYVWSILLNIATTRAPDNPTVYILSSDPRLYLVGLEHNKLPGRVPPGKGLVSLYPSSEWSQELYDKDDDVVSKELLAGLEPLVPGVTDNVEFTMVTRWRRGWMRSWPGYWQETAEFIRRSESRDRLIQLAGDYRCTSNVNNATAAGERAARELRAALVRD
jgi:oxygen-dependent protoporphyrinogen oxidase